MIVTLGSAQQTISITGKAASGAASAILPAVTHAAWAVPVVGAAIAGVTLALTLIFGRKGPQQKIEASKIADAVEPQLKANLAAYEASEHTLDDQQAALENFDYVWAQLISSDYWGNPNLGEPGQRAIKDRSRGGKWDWFAFYRDPIASDPNVKSATQSIAEELTGSSDALPLLLGVGCLVLGVIL